MVRTSVLSFIVALYSCSLLDYSESSTVNGADSAVFVIESGSSVKEIADNMEKAGILLSEDRRYFLRALVRDGDDRYIKSGNYVLPVPSNPESLALALKKGPVRNFVTIPEGLTIEEVAHTLKSEASCDSGQFVGICKNPEFVSNIFESYGYEFRPVSLEGFLYPSSYDFGFGVTPEKAAQEMIFLHFKVTDSIEKNAETGLDGYESVILASMIEKEAKADQERSLIASVYINRLRIGMPLQCDATVLYALGGHRERLLFKDLEIDSPYNTYRNTGLPPTPICSPGKKSIEAAFNPSHTDYLYYVAKDDGTHIFSKTYSEHIKAVNSVRN
ncbi:endolytic transglycosylase MltG [candidate division WOR-3 bacterium]|nr:endolytic transglycosylase MltG [candidate division WOR-3 bacterium]